MNNLKGTQTEKNLLKSFAGESQARMRYDYFSKKAKKEELEQISAIFAETALNEKEHAKRFFKFLEGGELEITATFPAGKVSDTLENLKSAAEGENEEWSKLYPKFAETAEEEGFSEISAAFKMIAKVEMAHEERYKKLYANLENGKVFKREEKIIWKCRNCGYLHEGEIAPEKCPACLHPQAYFEIKENNY
ncbi:rubrerythrin [Patescibacteria group bacterium]